jgi:hypothetical protein
LFEFGMKGVVGELERDGIKQSEWPDGHALHHCGALDPLGFDTFAEQGHRLIEVSGEDRIARI